MTWIQAGSFQRDEETMVYAWECDVCGREADSTREEPAPCVCELAYSLEHLRILTGPICAHCWTCDGEIVPATHRTAPYYGPAEDECQRCYDREPGDQGIDDGPLSFAERCAENEREFRGLR